MNKKISKSWLFFREVMNDKRLGRADLFCGLRDLWESNFIYQEAKSILELGYSRASHERTYLKNWKILKTNFFLGDGVDFFIDANKPFPLEDKFVDGVVFFQVFYLVDDYLNCLSECMRVSKKFVVFNVPLLASLAPHPHDFNRFTPDRIRSVMSKLQEQHNFSFEIIPLGGSFSSVVSIIDPYLRWRILRVPIYLIAKLLDKLDKLAKRQSPYQYLVSIRLT
jgi:hypothetical protein